MQSTITRLALFQFVTIFYSILAVGLILKVRFGSPAPDIFATHRDYGVLLLLLPSAWLMWASVSAHRPLPGTGDFGSILASGLLVLGLLLALAVFGTFSAVLSRPLRGANPPPQTAYSRPPMNFSAQSIAAAKDFVRPS